MASWAPQVSDVTGHIPAWEHAADPDVIAGHIVDAVTEITGEIGYFDADHVFNPAADPAERRTLGDLAHQAAEFLAADLWVSGIGPEMGAVDDVRRELFAKYQRALNSLRRHATAANRRGRTYRAVPMTPWWTP